MQPHFSKSVSRRNFRNIVDSLLAVVTVSMYAFDVLVLAQIRANKISTVRHLEEKLHSFLLGDHHTILFCNTVCWQGLTALQTGRTLHLPDWIFSPPLSPISLFTPWLACVNAIIKRQTVHCTEVMFRTEPILKPLPVVGRILNHQWRDGLRGKQQTHWHGDCSMSPIVFENVLRSSIGIFFNFIFAFQRHFWAVLEQFRTSLRNSFGRYFMCIVVDPNASEPRGG